MSLPAAGYNHRNHTPFIFIEAGRARHVPSVASPVVQARRLCWRFSPRYRKPYGLCQTAQKIFSPPSRLEIASVTADHLSQSPGRSPLQSGQPVFPIPSCRSGPPGREERSLFCGRQPARPGGAVSGSAGSCSASPGPGRPGTIASRPRAPVRGPVGLLLLWPGTCRTSRRIGTAGPAFSPPRVDKRRPSRTKCCHLQEIIC
uniref:Uncharacterized protein n=1 Tax=Desulfovibrio sp. U5L TaxID=596152 RepID=I2Q6U8_9BACT